MSGSPIGREPAVVGETLMLDVDDGDAWHRLTMYVIESRPIDPRRRHALPDSAAQRRVAANRV
jgi:hypothetical protein